MRYIILSLVLGALAILIWISTAAQDDGPLATRGQELLATNCARCHAIGRTGHSTHPEAPPFRTLDQRYPIENLAEALGEGLSTGHPDMPEFVFEVEDVGAILTYLQLIQSPRSMRPAKK